MAYVPSDQRLGRHPKTRIAADLLGISIPLLVGHLHLLWHWAMDFAQDGDLSHFTDAAIEAAAMWDGEPGALVAALINCGTGGKVGFIEPGRVLHDWDQYGGKVFTKRDKEAQRMREWRDRHGSEGEPEPVRARHDPPDPHVLATPDARNAHVTRTSRAPDTEPEAPPKPRRSSGPKPPIADFVPTEGCREWLAAADLPPNLDVARETEKFNDYRKSHRPKWSDLEAAWKNWLRRAEDDVRRGLTTRPGGRRPAASVESTQFDPDRYKRWRNGDPPPPTKEE